MKRLKLILIPFLVTGEINECENPTTSPHGPDIAQNGQSVETEGLNSDSEGACWARLII